MNETKQNALGYVAWQIPNRVWINPSRVHHFGAPMTATILFLPALIATLWLIDAFKRTERSTI